MTISKKLEETVKKSSWIRKMFEEGARLKAEHGAENVFDFSLGNPNLPPPPEFGDVLRKLADSSGGGEHMYMSNLGFESARNAVAGFIAQEQDVEITGNEIIMTCGAAGALNVILKSILDPDDEVVVPMPYFVEYNFYVGNHGGVLKLVPTKPDFMLDVDAIGAAINEKTKAVLINSPNNPTGQVYPEDNLRELGDLLKRKSGELNRTIYLISDEPYRKIVYNGVKVPSIFRFHDDSLVATSYSKDLSLPGERIGFLAVNPKAAYRDQLIGGMAIMNRTLGYINAPAFMQRVVAELQHVSVDIGEYTRKRDLLCNGLAECGYDIVKPAGTFYLFPKSPIPDDVEFVKALQKELVLTVPGSGFGGPGYFRIAFCVDDKTIMNALPAFEKVIRQYK